MPVLAQLGLDEGQRQPGADERDVRPLAQQVRHGADVVLVPVGEHDRLDAVEAVPDGVEVGQDQVDARLVVLGEEHPAVDDQQPAVVLEDGHVAADLAEAAQRDDAQAVLGRAGGGGRAPGGSRGDLARRRQRGRGRSWRQLGSVGVDERGAHGAGREPEQVSAALTVMAPWVRVDALDDRQHLPVEGGAAATSPAS